MRYTFLLIIFCITGAGCQKGFLDKKPNKAIVIPNTLQDFRALMEDMSGSFSRGPALTTIAGDEFYTSDGNIQGLQVQEQNSYLWEKDVYGGETVPDWDYPYNTVFVTNVALEGLEKIKGKESPEEWGAVAGTALYHRAFAFFNLAQEFTLPYRKENAATTPGIPIRTSPDITVLAKRGTLVDTYKQITDDLLHAQQLLPLVSSLRYRPSKGAALALLARVYLTMNDYGNAEKYANEALQLSDTLVDFNFINVDDLLPFPGTPIMMNPEVICFNGLLNSLFMYAPYARVDSNLYASYHDNDLRKRCYFNAPGSPGQYKLFKGTYAGSYGEFNGPANDELYLIRAECLARREQKEEALKDLNKLLVNRWKQGTYIPVETNTAKEALAIILAERKKELVARNLRWSDLRRLNNEPAFQVTLKRVIGQKEYLLPPMSNRYAFPIPDNEIRESGIEQNKR